MTADTTNSHVARTDVATRTTSTEAPPDVRRRPRAWALAGLLAGLTGVGTVVTSMSVDAVYDPALDADPAKISEALGGMAPQIVTFHVLGMITAVLLLVFGAGLYRRLRATAPVESLAPALAALGVFATSFVLLLGTGLDTEFVFGAGTDEAVAESVVFYNHWIGTIPWCWGLLGLSGLALFALSRSGSVTRWLGLVGLIGGGITLLLGISPLQYMAGMTAPIGLIVVALGFLLGDRAFRGTARD
ncbi:hypothetical protein [Nocardioides insulae]|uniref:hypothetical protein n=1 Tax=Nocardioides insulae TaxID=394734 RepID=UPI00041C94FD|nr:hypothetical protein [Nocardioides insulae]